MGRSGWLTWRALPWKVRWHKRIWSCPDGDWDVRTWTEQAELAGPRRVLSDRAATWAVDRFQALEGTTASLARGFGASWWTVWTAVKRVGQSRLDDAERVGPTAMVGFDETVMQRGHRRRRRRFITAVVDVATGQILDVFEGRDAKDLRHWLTSMPAEWLAGVQVVSVDPHEGYRSAVLRPDAAGRPGPLAGATVVVDPFHVVRVRHEAPCVRGHCRTRQRTNSRSQ